jgi:monoterpene epsilon-lactone hydrolase
MPSEQMQAIAQAMRANRPTGPAPSVAAQRQAMESMQLGLPMPADVDVENVELGGVGARWVTAPGARSDRVVLYLHGGGYVMGSLDTHQELMSRISRATGARALGLDYRLAPEHPFPAALDDAVAGYRALLATGIDPKGVLVAGDSAGGGLTVATLVRLRTLGVKLPAGAVVFSPWTDLSASGASVRTRAEADPMIRPQMLTDCAAHYCAGTPATDPLVSPLFADLTGLPPLLIQVGDDEILLDDATRLAQRAKTCGVAAELNVWSGAFHVFQAFTQLPEAAEALEQVGRFARTRLRA